MRDLGALDDALAEHDADGYCFYDHDDADQYYLSGFDAPDPFLTLYTPDGVHLLLSELEYGRATQEARADSISRYGAYDFREHVAEYGATEGTVRTIAAFLEEQDVSSVLVPYDFSIGAADGLRDLGVDVTGDEEGVIGQIRSRKTDEEVEYMQSVQRANEVAMARAEELLREASIDGDTLVRDGEALTSEFVKQEIEIALLREGCSLDQTIVAGGADGASPHDRGSGPLPANEPIVIDIFPQDKATKYHADMTRTFVVGEADEEVRRRHELTLEAKDAAIDAVEAGVTGSAIHDVVCDVYEEAGYATLRSDRSTETGYIHGTGHGLGLEVHEQPRLNPDGDELEPGHVVTVEPGLYDPAVGGMRIEDVVVVTEDGYENITDYHTDLVLE